MFVRMQLPRECFIVDEAEAKAAEPEVVVPEMRDDE